MATSKIAVTEGSGKNVATNSFSEDAVTKEVGRQVLNNSSGTEVGTSAAPLEVNLRSSTVGVATSAKQDTGNTSLSSIDGKITAVNTGAVTVASSALPSGAATSAKQPALGTAGTASADVITVQGKASMTPLLTDASATTQPVSNGGLTELAAAINSSKVDVNIASSDVASGGTSAIDEGVFTEAVTTGTPAMGVYESVPTNLSDGTLGVAGLTTDRRVKTSATIDSELPAGTQAIGKLGANSGVDIGDVTINNASGVSAVNVQDGGNSLTVDGSVTANAGTNLNTSALALSATQTDKSQFTKLTDGTDTALVTASGEQNVLESNSASALTSLQLIDDVVYTDDTSTHSTGTSKGVGIMATATPTDTSVNANDIGMVAMTTDRRMLVDASGVAVPVTDNSGSLTVDYATTGSGTATGALRVELPTNGTGVLATVGAVTAITNALPAGTNAIGKLSANSGVDIGDVDVTTVGTITPGTAATSLGKAEDAAHTSGDVGVFALALGNEAQSTLAADGDYIGHAVDTKGNTLAVGNLANDAVDAGSPVKIGGQARTTNPTAVADADRVNFVADKLGKQVVVGSIRDLKSNQITTITASTSETTVVTAVASTFLDVYGVICVNSSATATNVSFKDSTAGTTQFNLYLPAGETRGFMLNESAAIKQGTVNNNWTATSSASVTSVIITMLTVKNT